MTLMSTCGSCQDMWPYGTVRCLTCGSNLTLTAGDRVNAKHFGGRRVWEAPSGRAKDAA